MPKAYSQKAIVEWFHRTLGVNAQPTPFEINTDCPACGGSVFFFNVRKKVGICHRASCGYTPKLDDLIEHVGFGPEEAGIWEEEKVEERPVVIELPGEPVLWYESGQYWTRQKHAFDYLIGRGITAPAILNWKFTSDGRRVYCPVYDEGKLVNYNSRVLPGVEDAGKKYLYAKGAKTSHYILGWEECKLWDELCLVENTFVSLAYRPHLKCSTVFGSYLSDTQVSKIASSRIKAVALLWDANTQKNAAKSCRKLHALGVAAAYWIIDGQPDNYPNEWVFEKAKEVLTAAREGRECVDLRSPPIGK